MESVFLTADCWASWEGHDARQHGTFRRRDWDGQERRTTTQSFESSSASFCAVLSQHPEVPSVFQAWGVNPTQLSFLLLNRRTGQNRTEVEQELPRPAATPKASDSLVLARSWHFGHSPPKPRLVASTKAVRENWREVRMKASPCGLGPGAPDGSRF